MKHVKKFENNEMEYGIGKDLPHWNMDNAKAWEVVEDSMTKLYAIQDQLKQFDDFPNTLSNEMKKILNKLNIALNGISVNPNPQELKIPNKRGGMNDDEWLEKVMKQRVSRTAYNDDSELPGSANRLK